MMNCDKNNVVGLIPAAGRGTRLAPFPCPKELFPIGYQDFQVGRTVEKRPKVISQYLVENIVAAGASRVFIILGDSKHDVARYYGNGNRFQADIAYLYQEELSGMPGALDLAFPWIGEADVLFGMPDTIIEPHTAFAEMLHAHRESRADLTLGLFKTDNPSKFGMVDFETSGRVTSTIDKPAKTHLTYMWGCACWSHSFTKLLRDHQRERRVTGRECVLGDVFNEALRLGMVVQALPFENGLYMDIGTVAELDSALKKFHL